MKLIALKPLRRIGGGPRIEPEEVFEADEERAEDLLKKGHAHYAEEEQAQEPTRDDLYEKAQTMGIKGRSTMTKEELEKAVNDPKNRERFAEKQRERGRSSK